MTPIARKSYQIKTMRSSTKNFYKSITNENQNKDNIPCKIDLDES